MRDYGTLATASIAAAVLPYELEQSESPLASERPCNDYCSLLTFRGIYLTPRSLSMTVASEREGKCLLDSPPRPRCDPLLHGNRSYTLSLRVCVTLTAISLTFVVVPFLLWKAIAKVASEGP